MEVFSLSGPSGTGKSTSALAFAYKHKIPAIIDDGLLIFNGEKIAGTSAKFEKNSYTAVKRATFFFAEHAKEVQNAIQSYFIGRILIIGTSDRMVDLIARRLNLAPIKHYFHVEDVRSSSEIKIAQFVRRTEGKHIIPIPYRQVDQSLFKKLIHRGKEIFSARKERIGETTIVRPDFHRGHTQIYKKAYKDILKNICAGFPEIEECKAVRFQKQGLPIIHAVITLKQPIHHNLLVRTELLQDKIRDYFHRYLEIELYAVNLTIEMSKKMESLHIC